MVWDGYLCMGGNEVVNNARAIGYSRTADCPVMWLKDKRACEGIRAAVGDDEYDYAAITKAPWYSKNDPDVSRGFLGFYAISIDGFESSTRTANVVEGIGDGGVIGSVRHGVKYVRVRGFLSATNLTSLAYGQSWLSSVLSTEYCNTHGPSCGSTDITAFADCPRLWDEAEETFEEWDHHVNRQIRHLHDVVCVSGPLVEQRLQSQYSDAVGMIVEFTLAAGSPLVIGHTFPVNTQLSGAFAFQDVPFNLVPAPSAETSSGTVVVARNMATNPSGETNATSWAASSSTVSGTSAAGFYTYGQSTDIAAKGTQSIRGRLLGNNGTTVVTNAVADLNVYQDVPLTSMTSLTRVSFSIWGAVLILAGASGSAIQSLKGIVEWRNSGGTAVGTEDLGSATAAEYSGRVFAAKSWTPPATAVTARVYIRARVVWSSSSTPANNSDIRVYADALAVTVP